MFDAEKLIKKYTDRGLPRKLVIEHIRRRMQYGDNTIKELDEAERRSGLIESMADAERLIKEYTDRGLTRKEAIARLRCYVGHDDESNKTLDEAERKSEL